MMDYTRIRAQYITFLFAHYRSILIIITCNHRRAVRFNYFNLEFNIPDTLNWNKRVALLRKINDVLRKEEEEEEKEVEEKRRGEKSRRGRRKKWITIEISKYY